LKHCCDIQLFQNFLQAWFPKYYRRESRQLRLHFPWQQDCFWSVCCMCLLPNNQS
jgi:hypothetical protein